MSQNILVYGHLLAILKFFILFKTPASDQILLTGSYIYEAWLMLWNFKTILYVNCCINIGGYQILCTSLSMICKIVNRGSSNDDQCYVSPKWNFKERHS